MDSSSSDQLPKSLQFLVCDLKDPNGNYLIHQFVLNNRKPRDSCSESDIRAALRSFPLARVNDYNEEGFTALQLAVIGQNSFMVKKLLSNLPTIDVNAKCGKDGTAFHLAAAADYFNRNFSLVKHKYGRTALGKSVKKASLEILKALVQYGAPVRVINGNEAAPPYSADLDAADRKGRTPLHEAVRYGHLEAVRVLVESGASVNASDNHGHTPLHLAIGRDKIDILKLLISKGADLNAMQGIWGKTPLHVAVEKGHLEAVRVLVESGAALDKRNLLGTTLLHVAAEYNRIDVLKLLISKGMDVNAKYPFVEKPLYIAVVYGRLEAVKVLVESGAALGQWDYERTIALRIAQNRCNRPNYYEILEYLNSRVSNVNAVVEREGRIASSDFRIIRLRSRVIVVPDANGKMGKVVEPPFKKRRRK